MVGRRVPSKLVYSSNKVCNKRGYNPGDRISRLPDDILILILSLLSFREAALTSVLSRRWRYLWTFIPRLDFAPAKGLYAITIDDVEVLYNKVPKYIDCMNGVVRLHKAPTLEEFRVRLPLDNRYGHVIDAWLKFAMTKQVQKLELNLSDGIGNCLHAVDNPYKFPCGLLQENLITSEYRHPRSFSLQPYAFVNFKSLKCLHFKGVHLPQEALDFMLSNCSLLESLTLHNVEGVVRLKVAGPTLRLKYLDAAGCYDLRSIEISDTGIVAIRCSCMDKGLCLRNLPSLVDLLISVDGDIRDLFSRISCCLSQLECLILHMGMQTCHDVYPLFEMRKLKQLELTVASEVETLLVYTSLIKAAPCLEKFVIQVQWDETTRVRKRKIRKTDKFLYLCLKEVEFSGYLGQASDVELVLHLLENAVALETITIDPNFKFYLDEDDTFDEDDPFHETIITMKKRARRRAKRQLKRIVPSHVKLVIL